MDWKLQFISQENLIKHVKATIDKYGEKLESFDIVRFNKNIIDPVKMIFDKTVYQSSWEEIIGNEIFGKEISLTIMILDIFIREYFNISPVVMFRTMEQKAAGMLCLKRNQELICRKGIK